MAERRTTRAGSAWRPDLRRRPVVGSRTAGRTTSRLRLPAPSVRLTASRRRLFAAALFMLGLALAGWFLYHSSALTVQDVRVKGATTLDPEVVAAVAGLEGESLFTADLGAARERVEAMPRVKEASVSRDWLRNVRVTVAERQPWGLWQASGRIYVIDDEGVVLDLPSIENAPLIVQTDRLGEPLVAGDRVDAGAVAVANHLALEAERTIGRPVVALEFSQARGLVALLDGDLRVAFGDAQGYEFKVATLFAVLQQAAEEGRSLRNVDLRFGDRVAVQ